MTWASCMAKNKLTSRDKMMLEFDEILSRGYQRRLAGIYINRDDSACRQQSSYPCKLGLISPVCAEL